MKKIISRSLKRRSKLRLSRNHKALHFTLAPEQLHPAFADLMKTFNTGGKSYQLSVANALWGQAGYKFQPEFLKLTNKYYGAGFKPVDYVNERKREQTRQKINQCHYSGEFSMTAFAFLIFFTHSAAS